MPPITFCFLFRLELKLFHIANQTRSKVTKNAVKELKKLGNINGLASDDEPGKAICQRLSFKQCTVSKNFSVVGWAVLMQ